MGYNQRMEHIPGKWRLDAGQIEVVDEEVAEILRRMTPAERIRIASDAHRTARQLIAGAVLRQFPDWTPEQVDREVARRLTRGAD